MAWRVLVITALVVSPLLMVASVSGGDMPAQPLQLKTTQATPTPGLEDHPQGRHEHRHHHRGHGRHKNRGNGLGTREKSLTIGLHSSSTLRLEEKHVPSYAPSYLKELELGHRDGENREGQENWPDGTGTGGLTEITVPQAKNSYRTDLGQPGKDKSASVPAQTNENSSGDGSTDSSSESKEDLHTISPVMHSEHLNNDEKAAVLYSDQQHQPVRPKLRRKNGKSLAMKGNMSAIHFYDHPLYDMIHDKEFVNNASESLVALKEMQKNRLNKIYDVYMNNSMQLLKLESKLHQIGAEMMLHKDIHEELESTLERYRSLVNAMRIEASKEIQNCLKDIHIQSDQVLDNIQKDVNKTSEFKQYVSDQLEEVCQYLKTDEQLTIHELQQGLIQKDEEIAILRQQIYDLKKENSHLKVESEGFQVMTKMLSSVQHDSERSQETLHTLAKQMASVKKVVSTIGFPYQQITFEWKLHPFDYDTTWNGCRGPQYVQLSGYQVGQGKYVGVILCSPAKYKIFLSDDLHKKFLNIGDRTGNGEDHCEFVRSYREARFVSEQVGPTSEIDGYGRAHWGQRPYKRKIGLRHGYRSPKWYDCGIAIP